MKNSTWSARLKQLVRLGFMCLVAIQSLVAEMAQRHLQHGVNVGRFLDGALQNDSYKCCKLEDISLIQKMGFDHVRILVEPGRMFDFSQPAAIEGDSLKALDKIVGDCVTLQMGVILAMALDEDRFKDKLEKDAAFATQLANFWRSFARHYSATEFPPELIFFEVKNEPGLNEKDLSDAQWSAIQAELVAAIRGSAAKNTIIVTGAQNSDIHFGFTCFASTAGGWACIRFPLLRAFLFHASGRRLEQQLRKVPGPAAR